MDQQILRSKCKELYSYHVYYGKTHVNTTTNVQKFTDQQPLRGF